MTIIKAADLEGRIGVHGLLLSSSQRRVTPVIVPDPAEEVLEALRAEVEGLSGRVAERDTELAELRRALGKAREEGLVEGRTKGLAEAQSREAERVQALENNLAAASVQLDERLAALEPVALLIARECLGKVLGDAAAYPDLITSIVRRQLAGLKDQSVLAVEVSGADFRDGDMLARLAADLARPAATIEVAEDLESGACRLRLMLGTIEVGVTRQWEQLSRLLRQLAEGAA